MNLKPSLLFVYEHKYPDYWRDGLWAALQILKKDFSITFFNLHDKPMRGGTYNFALGWGAFSSLVDKTLRQWHESLDCSTGLCIAGNATPPEGALDYDVLFYETKWYRPQIDFHPNIIHAFGVNTDIYQTVDMPELFDWLTVGAFALWKRQDMILKKEGIKLAVGEIQLDNYKESLAIIQNLLLGGCAVSDMVPPETLARIYCASRNVYIPADIMGGGERAVMEAKACGVSVEIEPDNMKLMEILHNPILDHHYYAEQLKEGILSCV